MTAEQIADRSITAERKTNVVDQLPTGKRRLPTPRTSNRKEKDRKGSKGSTKAAAATIGSSEHLSEAEISGPLADREGSDIKFWGERGDHQQGTLPAVQPLAVDSPHVGDALKAGLSAMAPQATGLSVTEPGAERMSATPSAPLFPTEDDNEEESDGRASEGRGLLTASASRGSNRHRKEIQRDVPSQGGDEGGLDSGVRSEPRENSSGESHDDNNSAGKATANLKVRYHMD